MMSEELKTPNAGSRKSLRRLGWMAAALLTVGALLAPSSAALGAHESPGEGSADCPTGTTFLVNVEYNEESGTFDPATVEGFDFEVVETDDGPVLRITNNTDDTVTVVVKGGSDDNGGGEGTAEELSPGETADVSAPVNDNNGMFFGVSNFSICLVAEGTTTTTTDVSGTTTTTTDTTTDTTTTDTTTTDTTGTTTTTTDTSGTTTTTTDTTGTTVTTTDTTGTTVTTTDTTGTTVTTTDTSGTTVTTTDTTGTTMTTTNTGGVSPTTSTSSTGTVSGTTGGPAPTLPPTSTDGAQTGTSSTISFALLILAAASLALVMARPLSTRKNDR